ncbi:unnamed protein product [Cyclocybe aegerita]|uniref:Uncharacterized protein n=1 Tax=Cyclocybe aegerita TaxID=1973307 RepID=A0A8S0VV55_CYCAE|nr:unnamed protein product [Cyclocybe aegerita]
MAIYRRIQLHYTSPGAAPPSSAEEKVLRDIVNAIEISIEASTNSAVGKTEDKTVTEKFDTAMKLVLGFCEAYPTVQARWSKDHRTIELEYGKASVEDTYAAQRLQEIMMALKKTHIFSSIPKITFRVVIWHEKMVKWDDGQNVGPYSVAEEYKIEEKASVDIMLCRLVEHSATTSDQRFSLSLAQNPQLYEMFPNSKARFDAIVDAMPTNDEESPKIYPVFPWVVMKKVISQSNALHVIVNRRHAKDNKVRTHTGQAGIPEGHFNLWPFLEHAWSPHPERVVVRDFSGRLLLHDVHNDQPSTGYSSQTSFSTTSTAANFGSAPTDAIIHKKQFGNNNVGRSPQSKANLRGQFSERGKKQPSGSLLPQSTPPGAESVPADIHPSTLLAPPSSSAPISPRGQIQGPPHNSLLKQQAQQSMTLRPNLPGSVSSSRPPTPAIPGQQPYHTTPAAKMFPGSEDTLVPGPSSQKPPGHAMPGGPSGKATITPNASAAASPQAQNQGKKKKPGLDSTRNLHSRNQMETLEDEGQGKKGLLSRFGNKVSSWVFRS